ncbi:efflux RND transporter permease subunit [Marinobacteraceae bacterium S3BR75-40.1]
MIPQFSALYRRVVLQHPVMTLLAILILGLVVGLGIKQFRLDASSESLTLENDQALELYRTMARRFESTDEFLVVTYDPKGELFTRQSIDTLRNLRDDLAAVEGVSSTNSILNVPLLYSPELSLRDVQPHLKNLDEDPVPLDKARQSLLDNPLYPNLLLSEDAQTTAIQVNIPTPERYYQLLDRRNALQDKQAKQGLNADDAAELAQVSREFRALQETLTERQEALVARIRTILDGYRDNAEIHLGGVPMIVTDMIRFIANDLETFGIGVVVFILLTLAIIFRQSRWVVTPLLCCLLTVWFIVGYLGWVDWPVTVISSNFVSLLLIITLSLVIHLIVRFREYQQERPEADAQSLTWATVKAMAKPCFYMAVTTIVAFSSLTFSGIRPVIDFGWMMTLGMAVAFVIAFTVFPTVVVLLPRARPPREAGGQHSLTTTFARLTERHGGKVLAVSALLLVFSVTGMSRLSVENRFIDYFKDSTEIHQGMLVIDHKLGGTTPLDVIVGDPFYEEKDDQANADCDPFIDPDCENQAQKDTWFTQRKIGLLKDTHDYLNQLDASGKVLSIATTVRLTERINQGEPLEPLELAFVPKVFPEDLQGTLIEPYIASDHHQARLNIRLIDSLPGLNRNQLIERIEDKLVNDMGFKPGEVHLTGMAVLYNNMLQSLFDSQIKTLGIVFVAITLMFLLLFRSLSLALIGIAPNLLAAGTVLGLMGWWGIPLDLMTITVASITVGIAVDDTIHYIHRFRVEFAKDRDYRATLYRCHGSIGRAMLYTSLTVIAGFSILVLSNFIPTVYFGLLTSLAMAMALLGALTLLPQLIRVFKPFGPEAVDQA